MAIVVDQHHGFKPLGRYQRCKLQSYTHFDHNILENGQDSVVPYSLKQEFDATNFHRSFSTPCLSLANAEDEFKTCPNIQIVGGYKDSKVRALVAEVAIAIASGIDPIPVSSGLGGAYFICSSNGDNIAVVKPIDEEPLAFNNPKGFGGRMLGQPGLKCSVRIGETGIRELAAYLLDHDGFAGVPPTALVKISHVAFHPNNAEGILSSSLKIASIQRFVDHEYDAGELGSSSFSVASVHRIGIFDVRLLNLDRHAGNILAKKHDHKGHTVTVADLVPIDHGLCLPEWLDDPYFEWLHWPQASVPFSEFELEYIFNLDPFNDAELLRSELPSLNEACIRVLVVCTIFLKQAASAGLCLAEMGQMMTREFCAGEENFSVLDSICEQAKPSIPSASDDSKSRANSEESELFEVDYENEDEDTHKEVSDLPRLLQSNIRITKQPKAARFSSTESLVVFSDAASSTSHEDNELNHNNNKKDYKVKDVEGGGSNCSSSRSPKTGSMVRSTSFPVQKFSHENSGISLGDMGDDDWGLFLKNFEMILPEIFEGTKCLSQKQRLGTSCMF